MTRRWSSGFLPVQRVMWLALACMAWTPQGQAADSSSGWHMNVPNGYRQAYEDGGQTLVLTPAKPELYEVRFTYHSLKAYVDARPSVGREFIEHLAAKKGLKAFAVEGNGGVAFFEPSVVVEQDGGRVQETTGALGLDDAYVTFTVAIDEASLSDPVVKQLLQSGVQVMLGRIRTAPR